MRAISEFESSAGRKTRDSSSRHHEQSKANHKRMAAQVKSLVGVMTDMGNPFEEESADLLLLLPWLVPSSGVAGIDDDGIPPCRPVCCLVVLVYSMSSRRERKLNHKRLSLF